MSADNWQCPQCSALNPIRRQECWQCKYQRPTDSIELNPQLAQLPGPPQDSKVIFCRSCGKPIPEGSEFCLHCGISIKDSNRKPSLQPQWEHKEITFPISSFGKITTMMMNSKGLEANSLRDLWLYYKPQVPDLIRNELSENWEIDPSFFSIHRAWNTDY